MSTYATWDASKATDAPDGMPDTLMVPVVERLRAAGIVTFQSCQGHAGHSDAHLWFAADLSDAQARALARTPGMYRVARMFSPEDCWEAWWVPADRDREGYERCVAAVLRAAAPSEGSEAGG